MDRIDLTILDMLQQNARMSNAEIGRTVGLAPSSVYQRIKKMEDSGVLQGYAARIDPSALGFATTAYVMIKTGEGAVPSNLAKSLGEMPEVQEVHRVVGEDCFFVKVRVGSPSDLADLLDERIRKLPAISQTNTTMVLSSPKETTSLPIVAA